MLKSIRDPFAGEDDGQVDLTNLIDLMTVVCALLMIFLPTASFVSAHVQLQEVQDGGRANHDAESIVILSFTKAEELRWDDTAITWSELEARLEDISKEDKPPRVYLAGDREASYGFSLRLEAILNKYDVTVRKLVDKGD